MSDLGPGFRAGGRQGGLPRAEALQFPGTAAGCSRDLLARRAGRESWLSQSVPVAGAQVCPQPRRAASLPQQLDPENTGFIGADTFTGLVHSHELPLDPAKLDMLVALAQSNERGQICYQELVDLVSALGLAEVGRAEGRLLPAGGSWDSRRGQNPERAVPKTWPCPQISSKRSSSFKRAIANGQRALPQEGLLDEPGLGVYKRFVRYVAYEILPREVDRHWYFYRQRSCPPPVFMASVTLTQVGWLPNAPQRQCGLAGPALTALSPRSSCSCATGLASTSGCCRPTTPST